ncbi:MAG: hypothetical protein IJF03_09955 [Lachnospiraceae bacterium]|nr:hypothetical protein [Lachnospiraceae bacterium]
MTNRRKTLTCSQRCVSKRSAARRKYNASCISEGNKRKTTEIGTIENMAREVGLTYGQYVAMQYAKEGR